MKGVYKMTIERKKLSIQTVKDNIKILEEQEPDDAGYYLQLEHEKFVLECLEKQIPRNVKEYRKDGYYCTICKAIVYPKSSYCNNCGQALDWNGDNGRQ
jgi:hypothetical protein